MKSWPMAVTLAGICIILAVVVPYVPPAGGSVASVICLLLAAVLLGVGISERMAKAAGNQE